MEDENFPVDPKTAIREAFARAEDKFLYSDKVENWMEVSGSCALICLIVENTAYIANVGDSRAVLSELKGKHITPITIDHKPNSPDEEQRIRNNGGSIYK